MSAAKPQYVDGPVKFAAVSAVIFLVLGATFGDYAAFELAWPFLNFDIPEITFARLRVIHTNTVIYAFGGMTLMATAFYSVQRTNANRIWSPGLAWFTVVFFFVGLLLAVITLALGMTQGKEYAELVWWLDLAVAVIWLSYTINFVMTILTRDKEKVPHVYVSNWFFMGMMVAITYLYVVNNMQYPVSLFWSYSLFSGMQDAMIQWWWGHNAVGFFLTAGFLAIMYYFVPKQAQRPIYSYRLSVIHFWALMFGYVWLGAHHLQYSCT